MEGGFNSKLSTVEPLYKEQVGCLVVLFLEVMNVLSLWEVEILGPTCPLFRGCPLFGWFTVCALDHPIELD